MGDPNNLRPDFATCGDYGVVDGEVVGNLLDALNDELAIEISRNSHVKAHVRSVVAALGGPWASYLDAWWLT